MFCQKCGAKVIEGASFCRECGAKLVKEEEIQNGPEPMTEPVPKPAETPKMPVQPVSLSIEIPPRPRQMSEQTPLPKDMDQQVEDRVDIHNYNNAKQQSYEKDLQDSVAKKKRWKMLVILGVILLAIVFVSIGLSVFGDNAPSADNKGDITGGQPTEIDLSETYINAEEGVSFKYPSNWSPLSESDFVLRQEMLNPAVLISEIYATDVPAFDEEQFAPYMQVLKTQVNSSFSGTMEDFQNSLSLQMDNVQVTELSDIVLSNHPWRKLAYSFRDSDGKIYSVFEYYYAIYEEMYAVRFYVLQKNLDKYESTFDAIMDSYVITNAGTSGDATTSSNSGEIYYKDIPMSELLSATTDDVVKLLGAPTILDREYCIYDDITFELSSEGLTTSVQVDDSSLCSVNGVTLNKNRDGLVEIFGEPLREGDGVRGYSLSYELPNYNLHINMGEPQGTEWRVTVSPAVS